MKAIQREVLVNVPLLLQTISRAGGIARAAALWRTSPGTLHKLLAGKRPSIDAMTRVINGSKLSWEQLFLSAPLKTAREEKVVRIVVDNQNG